MESLSGVWIEHRRFVQYCESGTTSQLGFRGGKQDLKFESSNVKISKKKTSFSISVERFRGQRNSTACRSLQVLGLISMCNGRIEIDRLLTGMRYSHFKPPSHMIIFHTTKMLIQFDCRTPVSSHRKKRQPSKKRWSYNYHGLISHKWYRTNQKSIHIRMSIRWVAEHFHRSASIYLGLRTFHLILCNKDSILNENHLFRHLATGIGCSMCSTTTADMLPWAICLNRCTHRCIQSHQITWL